jgi:hypothetical protein
MLDLLYAPAAFFPDLMLNYWWSEWRGNIPLYSKEGPLPDWLTYKETTIIFPVYTVSKDDT